MVFLTQSIKGLSSVASLKTSGALSALGPTASLAVVSIPYTGFLCKAAFKGIFKGE